MINNMAYGLNGGKKYFASIDRISVSGNGIIDVKGKHLNLGEMSESKEGKVVTFIYEGSINGDFLQMGKHNDATRLLEDFEANPSRSSYSSSSGTTDSDNPVKDKAGSKNGLLNGFQ